MAVSSSDPLWLLCAIRWVVSAERDSLVSTDTFDEATVDPPFDRDN
jgi:hypothetical protein